MSRSRKGYSINVRRMEELMKESQCPLCKFTFRDPVSARCKHPVCKSCTAVLFTRNLPALDKVICPTCGVQLNLLEFKSDTSAERKLKMIKSCKCDKCGWNGSYTNYIQKHERNCGGGTHIQCKVLGCGAWLPEKRALDVHRTDEWCPMILIIKARLNPAEIVHLSMRETWDWTCGLVLRSDKPSVRDLIERLVTVFSALDPEVPTTLENDEYAANQTSEPDCSSDSMSNGSNQSEIRSDERKDVRPRQNESSGKTSPADECDGESLKTLSSSSVAFKSEASGATNGFLLGSSVGDLGSGSKGFSGAVSEKDILRMIQTERKKSEGDLETIKNDTMDALKILEPLKNMPKAFAAIADKQEVFESVLGTFNKDVMRVHSRLDKLNLSPSLMNQGISEKLQKKYQELERALLSLRQDGTKVEERLLTLETSYSGVYLWPIPNYSERKRDAMNTNIKSIYSPPFFTSQYGYKLCGRVFLMGDGVGKGTHISLFLTIMRGPHDSVLPWPFNERITFQLINQDDPINKSIIETFRPDPASSSFKKPTTEKNIGAGCPLLANIQMVEDLKSGFIRDNTIFLKIISQTSDVPEFNASSLPVTVISVEPTALGGTNGFLSRSKDDGVVCDNDESAKIKKDIRDALKILEPLKNMPKAFAAIADKQEVFESALATFNKDVVRLHSRLDKLNLSPSLMNQGISEKLQKKYLELERALVSLRQDGTKVEERLLRLETSYSGVYLWPIPNYSERKRDAMNTNIKSIYSLPFFTSQYGYKLCGRVFLMGDGVGKGTHISLFLTIMRGPHDSVLPWPFKERITFQLVNQDDPINKSIVEAFRPDPTSSSFKKPTTEKNIGAGCPLFAKIKVIEEPKSGFIRDNTIYLKIISQTSDVPEIK